MRALLASLLVVNSNRSASGTTVAMATPIAELALRGGALGGPAGATLASFCVGANLAELAVARSDIDMRELGPALMVGCAQLARVSFAGGCCFVLALIVVCLTLRVSEQLDVSDVDLRHPRASELLAAVVKTRRSSLRW